MGLSDLRLRSERNLNLIVVQGLPIFPVVSECETKGSPHTLESDLSVNLLREHHPQSQQKRILLPGQARGLRQSTVSIEAREEQGVEGSGDALKLVGRE